jgi:hypothetical protein
VYNEKIFDLFDPNDKRKALSLKTDRQAGNKYIQGLKEVRIWSNEVSGFAGTAPFRANLRTV